MITKIHLHNFQKHSDLVWNLDPNINIITGSSDQGKSSIFRALYWLAFNRPIGSDFFIKFGTKYFFVEITLDDGSVIKRGKDKEGSYYTLNGERFSGIGTSVPRPIQEKLNLEELNFSGQHDPLFLLGLSRPEASRYIASLIDLDEMEKVLSGVEKKRRKSSNKVEMLDGYLEEIIVQKSKIARAPEMLQRTMLLKEAESLISEKKVTESCLEGQITLLKEVEKRIIPLNKFCDSFNKIDEILEQKQREIKLSELLQQYARITNTILALKYIPQAEDALRSLFQIETALLSSKQKIKGIQQTLNDLSEITNKIGFLENKIASLQETWEENMKDVCPLCGSKL